MLPDRSLLLGQKLMKNNKIQNFKCDILSGQKLIKIPKMVNLEFWSQTVLPDRSIRQKRLKMPKLKTL